MDSNAAAVSFYINAISIRHRRKLHVNISIDINITLSYFHTGTFVEVIRTVLDYQLVSLDGGCAFNCLLEQRHSTSIVTLFSHQYQLVIACINGQRCFYVNSSLTGSGNSSISCKNILAVLDIASIFSICCSITGQSGSELGFRRNNRSFGRIAAFAILFAKGDVAGLLFLAACGQAISNFYRAGQVLLTACKVAICQLASQCVQHVSYTSVAIHSNAGVIGNQGNNGILLCMLDNSVACCVVCCCFTVAGMSIEDIGIAAVVINSQVINIFLEDITSFALACTANKVIYSAALESISRLAPLFIVPGCAILQPQVCSTGKGHATGNIFITIVICYSTSQARAFCGQAKVNCTFCTMNIASIGCTGRKNHIAFDVYIISICTGNIAVFTTNNVHVNSGVLGSDSSIVHVLLFTNNDATALDINHSAAGVSKQTVAIALEVYITINSNSAALCITHAAGCINTRCTVIFSAAIMAFKVYLCITVDNNITLAINTNGVAIALSSNVQVTINS